MIKNALLLVVSALVILASGTAFAAGSCELLLAPDVQKHLNHPCTQVALDFIRSRIAPTQPQDIWPDLATEVHFFAFENLLFFSFSLESTRAPAPIYMSRQTWLVRVQLSGGKCTALEANLDEFENTAGGGGVSVHN